MAIKQHRHEIVAELRELAEKLHYPNLVKHDGYYSQFICDNLRDTDDVQYATKQALYYMGMGMGSYEFDDMHLWPRYKEPWQQTPEKQHGRVMWLLFAAHVIEDGGV